MFQLIFPVVGSFFSLSLRSPMVTIRSPGHGPSPWLFLIIGVGSSRIRVEWIAIKMSETQYEEPVYVVNKQRRESEAVVHMPDRSGNATRIPSPQPETMNGSVQRTIPNVMLPFRSMIPKSRSAAYYGSEYQLPHYAATDILPSRSALWPAYMPPSPTSKCSKTSKIKPSPKMGPGFPLPRTIGNGAEYQVGHYAPPDIFRRVFALPEACLEYAKRG